MPVSCPRCGKTFLVRGGVQPHNDWRTGKPCNEQEANRLPGETRGAYLARLRNNVGDS